MLEPEKSFSGWPLSVRVIVPVNPSVRWTYTSNDSVPSCRAELPVWYLAQQPAHVLTGLSAREVGCESNGLTLAEAEALCQAAPTINWKPLSDRVERLRLIKDESPSDRDNTAAS